MSLTVRLFAPFDLLFHLQKCPISDDLEEGNPHIHTDTNHNAYLLFKIKTDMHTGYSGLQAHRVLGT